MLPVCPSAWVAALATIASAASSFRIVPAAVAPPISVPLLGLESVTVKPSSGSTPLSAATSTVMVRLVSPAAKFTVPAGSTPPTKSVAAAGLAPLPVTAQPAVLAWLVLPLRLTVKV